MSTNQECCQQCFQPLLIQQIFPQKELKKSHDILEDLQREADKQLEVDAPNIMDQDPYFFGLVEGSTADISNNIVKGLKIKDFAHLASESHNVQLRHPVCFDCFEEILKQLDFKVKSQEQERDMYKQELNLIE